MWDGEDKTSVRVALRVRPLNSSELGSGCRLCLTQSYADPNQIIIGDRSFTFDRVFDQNTRQETVEQICTLPLVDFCKDGFNSTLMAYGQTGSGKTYTIGTAGLHHFDYKEQGLLPRAIERLFKLLESDLQKGLCTISVSFLELYNEELVDLLATSEKQLSIREDPKLGICVTNLEDHGTKTPSQALRFLELGASRRTTASNNLNETSSRSHSIFTINIKRLVDGMQAVDVDKLPGQDLQPPVNSDGLHSRLTFVDLAGSERMKRTGATGDRFKEGVHINSGLLALGNVISALGDPKRKASHVPYRNSKLTRLLQDSLGGNSKTVMIACVSPADVNFEETLNTLKYAYRARNIQNKPLVNIESDSAIIVKLKQTIHALQAELLEARRFHGESITTKDALVAPITQVVQDQDTNSKLLGLQKLLREKDEKIKRLKDKNQTLFDKLGSAKSERDYYRFLCVSNKIVEDNAGSDAFKDRITIVDLSANQEPQGVLCADENDLLTSTTQPSSETDGLSPSLARKQYTTSDDELLGSDQSSDPESEETLEGIPQVNKVVESLSAGISMREDLVDHLARDDENYLRLREEYGHKIQELQSEVARTHLELLELTKNMDHGRSEEEVRELKKSYEEKIARSEKLIKHHESEHNKLASLSAKNKERISTLQRELDDMKKQKTQYMRKLTEETAAHRKDNITYDRRIQKLIRDDAKKLVLIKQLEDQKSRQQLLLQRRNEELAILHRRTRGKGVEKTGVSKTSEVKGRTDAREVEAELERAIEACAQRFALSQQLSEDIRVRGRIASDMAQFKSKERASSQRTPRSGVDADSGEYGLEDQLEALSCELSYRNEKINQLQTMIASIPNDEEALSILDNTSESTLKGVCRKLFRCSVKDRIKLEGLSNNLAKLKRDVADYKVKLIESQEMVHQMRLKCDVTVLGMVKEQQDKSALLTKRIESNMDDADLEGVKKEIRSLYKYQKKLKKIHEEKQLEVVVEQNQRHHDIKALSEENVRLQDKFDEISKEFEMLKVKSQRKIPHEQANTELRLVSGLSHQSSTESKPLDSGKEQLPVRVVKVDLHDESEEEDDESKLSAQSQGESGPMNVFSRLTDRGGFTGIHRELHSSGNAPKKEPATPAQNAKPELIESCRLKGFIFESAAKCLNHHDGFITHASVTESSIYTVSNDRKIFRCDINRPTSTKTKLVEHGDLIRSMILVSEGQMLGESSGSSSQEADLLVYGCKDRLIRIYDIKSGQIIQTLQGHRGEVISLCYGRTTSAGDVLISGGEDATIRVWDMRMLQAPKQKILSGHRGSVFSLKLSEDGETLYSGSRDHYVRSWGLSESRASESRTFEPPHYDCVSALALVGSKLYSGSRDGSIHTWSLPEGYKVRSQKAHGDWVQSMVTIPHANILISGCRDREIRIWSTASWESMALLGHTSSVNCLALNRSVMVSGSSDRSLRIWRFKEKT